MKRKMRRTSLILTVLILILSMSATAFAGTLTKADAVKKACRDARLTAAQTILMEVSQSRNAFEVEFVKKSNQAEYSYEISKTTGVILEKEVEYVYTRNSSKSKIGVEAARKKVAAFSGISLTKIKSGTCRYEYDTEDREGTYTVRFRSGNYRYEYEVLAPTGVIIEYSRKYVGKNR